MSFRLSGALPLLSVLAVTGASLLVAPGAVAEPRSALRTGPLQNSSKTTFVGTGGTGYWVDSAPQSGRGPLPRRRRDRRPLGRRHLRAPHTVPDGHGAQGDPDR